MRQSIKIGFSFGFTSGIITTLGLMVGLYSGTQSAIVVLSGILTIAIADALSDSFGIHVSQEFKNQHTTREVWESTITTFLAKFFIVLTFLIPIIFFPLATSILIGIIWGLSLLTIFSIYIAKEQKANPFIIVGEHLAIALIIITITYYVGMWINSYIA